jgi:hypothetical protein
MNKFNLNNIESNYESFEQLIALYNQNKDLLLEDIELSFSRWFGANLSSSLGGILDKLSDKYNGIHFGIIPDKIKTIIQKNDFLSYYGFPKIPDINNTTIKYLKLKPTDGRYFNNYVFSELLNRQELPHLSSGLKKKIAESIYEIFVNAQIHSQSEFIYTCGQFFPKTHTIEFTITDTGVGFKKKINKRFSSSLTSLQAIQWAIKDGHSTKENVSGGIGLAILKEFVTLNKGKFQIISDDGFYQLGPDGEQTKVFKGAFPGTIVNMLFKTDDTSSYVLKGEIDTNDIF